MGEYLADISSEVQQQRWITTAAMMLCGKWRWIG